MPVFPELVVSGDKSGYLQVKLDRFTAVLLGATKELKEREEESARRIAALEAENDANEARIAALQVDNEELKQRLARLEAAVSSGQQ